MSDIHAVIRALKAKYQVKENLAGYFRLVSEDAYHYAAVNTALNVFSLAEQYPYLLLHTEGIPELKDLLGTFSGLFRRFASAELADENALLELREQNRELMETVSDLSELYRLAEYILNRLEHRFISTGLPEGYSDRAYTEQLLNRLAKGQADMQNLYLSLILPELPVRITRSRFLEYAGTRMTVYRQAAAADFAHVLHDLKLVTGMEEPESSIPAARALYALLRELRECDYRNFSELQYNRLYEVHSRISDTLLFASDTGNLLQEAVNGLSVLMLLREHEDPEEEALSILRLLSEAFTEDEEAHREALRKAGERIHLLEGRVEAAQERYLQDYALYDRFRNEFDPAALGLSDAAERLRKAGLLVGNSLYASLAPDDGAGQRIISEEEFEQLTKGFLSALAEHLAFLPKQYYRAAVGGFYRILPPYFATQETLENYIFDALKSCSDEAEKAGCIELIDLHLEDLR